MEKKSTRLQAASKSALLSDSKKSQDVASGKLWPRNGRRREPSGGSLPTTSKNEPTRNKTTNKQFEKKSRPRGNNNISATDRTEAARLETTFDAELGSVFVKGSKKQSLNHLLNFNYAPVGYDGNSHHNRWQDRSLNKGNNWMVTKKHKYNKEHYLQANCQFIVNASGDYKQYINNPDTLVDWNLIEQVNVQVSDYSSCPICLFPPMAAKMTRCGHIYCWSCILHYLSLELSDDDKPWRKCPICYERVYKNDLKSVVSVPHKTFNLNDIIEFKLMKRPKGCLTAYPATAKIINEDQIFNMSQIEAGNVYSKLLLATNDEIMSIIQREYNELQQQLDENSPDENCFVEQALILLTERKDKIVTIETKTLQESVSVDLINDNNSCNENPVEVKNIDAENLDISDDGNHSPTKYFYFYQASDGQHIYLHAINARMLEHTYGSLEYAPETLTGRILEKEGGSMTEDLRKRLRYLQHLPVTCQFEVAEIELKTPIVSKETLQMFNDQLDKRRKMRQRRVKEEKKREKRIADEENRLMGKYPVANIHLESKIQFPNFESIHISESDSQIPSNSDNSCENTPSNSVSKDNDYQGLSFAKMLASTSAKKPSAWPTLKPPTTSGPPMKLITVTGADMKSSLIKAHNVSDEDDEDLEAAGTAPPPCDRNLSDEIYKALRKAEENEVLPETDPSMVRNKKKKKKNRDKLLYTTSLAFTGQK